jgi:hypothetical protein
MYGPQAAYFSELFGTRVRYKDLHEERELVRERRFDREPVETR